MKLTLELNGQETMPEIQRMKALFDAFVKDADEFLDKQEKPKRIPPEGIPMPPDGWIYWGMGGNDLIQYDYPMDIACFLSEWDTNTGWYGSNPERHHAIRSGSELAKKLGLK